MLRVLVHIQRHLDETLSLEDLAAVAHFSAFHFHRVFRGMVGEPVKEHIRRLRLERAAHRPKFGNQPVTQLAFEAGYEAHEAFTRAFRTLFGESPSGFRAAHQTLPLPDCPSGVHFAPDGGPEDFNPVETGESAMNVEIKKLPPQRVAFMRHVGPYSEVGNVWGKLMAWAGPRGLIGPQTTMIGLVHDDPEVSPPEKIRYDACLTVTAELEPEGDVGVQEIAAGEYAVTTHHGPYEQLGTSYARLCGQWLAQSGRELRSAPGFEVYRNSPMNTPPADLLTDIHLPLEPR